MSDRTLSEHDVEMLLDGVPNYLHLRKRDQPNKGVELHPQGGGTILMPPIDLEDTWDYCVMVSETQAVVGFKKYTTIGIGFMVEDADWNTNLPYICSTQEIFEWILRNKGEDNIKDSDVFDAIKLIQHAAYTDRPDERRQIARHRGTTTEKELVQE